MALEGRCFDSHIMFLAYKRLSFVIYAVFTLEGWLRLLLLA